MISGFVSLALIALITLDDKEDVGLGERLSLIYVFIFQKSFFPYADQDKRTRITDTPVQP